LAVRHPDRAEAGHPRQHGRRTAGWALPLKTVQVRMGHGTLAMTADLYGHRFPSNDDAKVPVGEAALMDA
jgi:hypothetical protein